jgi:4-amino-4-deoxy-L-arabinose transferase-like glycosyltransferase
VFAPAGVLLTALLIGAGGYGFQRDELYFIANADHPAWGYVDHPPLTPMIGLVSRTIFGDTLRGSRTLPAVLAALIVVMSALICREMGGSRGAQLLAATATATSAIAMAFGHMVMTPTVDVLAWSTAIWLICRIVRTSDPHWWLAVGAVLGVGLLNKFTILFAIAGYGLALLLTPQRRLLFNPWLLSGAAIALLMWAPNIWWQIDHDWPIFEFTEAIADEAAGNRAGLLPFQILLIGPPIAIGAGVGWWHLARTQGPYRFVAFGFAIVLVLLMATGGKPYYSAGALPALVAAGAISVHTWCVGHRRTTVTVLAINCAINAGIALPIVPASHLAATPIADVNGDAAEANGWPEFIDQVTTVVQRIPATGRSTTVIFTGNYGEAGAIDRFGTDLPPVYSGHNSYADFGMPSGSQGPVVVVGYTYPSEWFDGCIAEGEIESPHGIDNEEDGAPLWLCDAPTRPWKEMWPLLRHIS